MSIKEILKPFYPDMRRAIRKTSQDGKERGFFIVSDVKQSARSRMSVGSPGSVTLKLKIKGEFSWDFLISFHTHGVKGDKPSEKDRETALLLREDYTVIGTVESVKVWKIEEKGKNAFIFEF